MREKKAELVRWAALQSQSVKTLADDNIRNAWLFNPALLKPSSAQDENQQNSVKPQQDLTCRKCRVKLETPGHILSTKSQRIKAS
jgi:hypothetical protein